MRPSLAPAAKPSPAPRAEPKAAAPAPAKADRRKPPYTVDADGIRHLKPECLVSGASWRLAAVLVASAVMLSPELARADVTRAQCVEAYERAQYMRRESKLRGAREALLVCAQDSCPAATRGDCVPWLAEVERALPTIVIAARDERG